MWQRFTERARRVVYYAQEAAGQVGTGDVGTEHLLLGLVREADTVAAKVLATFGVSIGQVRHVVETHLVRGTGKLGQDMQLTPQGKQSIDHAAEEAAALGCTFIGTEHLLLGLLHTGVASLVLVRLGVELDRAREAVRAISSRDDTQYKADETPVAPPPVPNPEELEKLRKPDATIFWNRFTERARRMIWEAQAEAGRLGENYVSTEHMLLGLVREKDSVAARILDRMGVSLGRIRSEIERQVTRGDGRLGQDMQLTPRAKRVIDLAYDEARQLQVKYIGTEHLLLGLIREGEGMAGRVLAKLDVGLEDTRRSVREFQDDDSPLSSKAELGSSGAYRAGRGTHPVSTREALLMVREDHGWLNRSLITLADVSWKQFDSVLSVATALKAMQKDRDKAVRWKSPRTLGMIFEKPSLRTRVSFEAGMVHLGGHAIYLAPSDIGLGTREPVADVALALSRWVDVISARVFRHETVEELAKFATVPVINALSDREHPIQAFADLLTLEEQKGALGNGLKVAYIGDGNNVLHALLLACAKMGVNLSAACPDGYLPDPEYVRMAEEAAVTSGAKIAIVTDPVEAAADADALYTDVWTSMGQEEERAERLKVFAPYQINAELMAQAKPDAIVLHCLPAHSGEEVSEEVYEKHRTVIMDQAENRMHTQKALIALMVGI